MKDILQDIVKHTHSLGFLDIVKITGSDKTTTLDSMAEDRSVIMQGEITSPVEQFEGTFGMPQLGKLDIHLKCPEYKTNATISVNKQSRNGEDVPVGIHFENSTGDFQNDYRFMNSEIINEKLKTVKFRGVNWDVEFEPSMAATQKLNFQAAANAEETTFVAQTDGTDLKFTFGDHSTHAGQFVFQSGVKGTLDKNWAWPVAQVLQILKLGESGKLTMAFSNDGALQITVDSGLATYKYILPAQQK